MNDDWQPNTPRPTSRGFAAPEVPTMAASVPDRMLGDVDRLRKWEYLARIEHAACERWQEMAEDLWEELQLWHDHGCPSLWTAPAEPGDCTCHRILAAKWDEITHAADWADDEPPDSQGEQ